jgi:hypothetical protein
VKNRFQSLPFKCNLQRYNEDAQYFSPAMLFARPEAAAMATAAAQSAAAASG